MCERAPAVSRPPRVRLVSIRVGLIPDARDSIYMPRPGTTIKKVLVPISWSESEFVEKIRKEFPQVRDSEFSLCKVDRRRRIIPLNLASFCPSAIRACLDVGRSSIYVRPTVREPVPEVQTELLADDTHSESSDSQNEMRRRQIGDGEQRRRKEILDREKLISGVKEPDDGVAIQLKYPDGRTTRRRFNVSQPFQHLVAFAGTDEMATEVFSVQPAMSSNAIYSSSTGAIKDHGINGPCTLYVLWLSSNQVQELLTNTDPASASPPPASRSPPPSLSPRTSQDVDVSGILQRLRGKLKEKPIRANQINAVRGEEFDCASRAFSRAHFDPESKLDVVFVDGDGGEGAIDEGGPTREFCRLLARQLQSHQIFEGPLERRTLALDSAALHNGVYRMVGKMLVVCLLQGGVSPNFFSERLYRQICGSSPLPGNMEEVMDRTLKEKLQKISTAKSLEEAREAVNDASEELSLTGSLCCLRTLEQRDELVTAFLDFYAEERIHAALQQFREGLSIFGALEAMKAHYNTLAPIFLKEKSTLFAADVVAVFKPSRLSLTGSSRRKGETRTIAYWRDWLLQVEDGETPLSLGDILAFATGLENIPAMGFPSQPELDFLHPEDGPALYPIANTVVLKLSLPVHQTYNKFKSAMETGIGCAFHFGVQ